MLKNKLLKNYKRIMAIMLVLFTLLTQVQPIIVYGASGSGTFFGGQYASYIRTTDSSGEYGVLIRRLENRDTGERVTAFCAEHSVPFATGTYYPGSYFTPSNPAMRHTCKIAYFGWYAKHGNYVVDGGIMDSWAVQHRKDYVYTQVMIWEYLGQSSGNFLNSTNQDEYNAFKADVNAKIAQMDMRPSFDGSITTIDVGESVTLTDTRGVFAEYNSIDVTVSGIRFQHNYGENTLRITVTEACDIENYRLSDATATAWGLIKAESADLDTTIYYQFATGVQDQVYSLNYNDPVPLRLELNINLLGNLEITKTNTNQDLINGSVFNLTGPNGYNQNHTVTNGKLLIEKLRRGTYTLKEINAPTGYVLNIDSFSVVIRPNETTTQTVVNEEPTGTIDIVKRDSETGGKPQGDASLKDAVYRVYADEDIYNVARTVKYYSKGDLVATRNTNEQGIAPTVIDLPLGKYTVKELTPSLGYLIDPTTYTVELLYANQNTRVITNTTTSNEVVKKQRVHIFKSGIKEQSGEVKGLEGAEFTIKLYSDVQKALAQGYTYAEIWDGIDENGDKVTVNASRVAQAQVIAPTYDTILTDVDGNAYTIELPYGKYLVKETKTPVDFFTAVDFTFTITQDHTEILDVAKKVKHIFVNNEQMETYIKLVKRDIKTNKIVSLSSATFEIKATKDIYDRGNNKIIYKAGETIKHKIGSTTYSSFTTNADNLIVPNDSYITNKEDKGTVITPLMLPVGSYEITEIRVPYGFLELPEPVKLEIKNIRSYDTDPDGDYIQIVNVHNEQPTVTLLLDKTVLLRENVDTSIVDISDLSGIKFELRAKGNVIDMADGSVIYKKDEVVGQYNLTKEGTLKIEELPIGTYEIQEIKTIDGLVLNKDIFEVKFTYENTTTKVYTKELEVENETTIFEISKTDITGEDELEGALLEIRDKDGNIIDSWISTDKPHTIEGLIVGETYTLIETLAPDEYVVATEIGFTAQGTAEMQKVHMIDKQVAISKVDVTGENEVEGAELEVQDLEGNTIDKWTSGEKPYYVSGLKEGETYILIETLAPDEYVVATEIEFTVTYDKDIQEVHMVDKQVAITKIDLLTGEEIEGAELEVQDLEGNIIDKWTSGKKPHYVSGLKEGETYILIETTAPYGYYITESIEFTVTYEKDIQKVVMKDAPILKNIQVVKTAEETGETITNKDFVFGIYKDSECKDLIREVTANTDEGTALFEDLRYGIYYIKELKAPEGYKLSEQIVKIEINEDGVFADEELLEEIDNVYSFTFSNEKMPIVETGDNRNIDLFIKLLILAVIGLLYFAVVQTKKYFKEKGVGGKNGKVHNKSNIKNRR